MKTKSTLMIVTGLCGLVAAGVAAENRSTKSHATSALPKTQTSPTATPPAPATSANTETDDVAKQSSPAAKPASTVKPSSELAASQALEEANAEHIKESRTFLIVETPPPALREEKKPPAPASGLVWVPGHWVPVKGEWQWRAGHWGFPATPVSVWIDSKYDPKTKRWTAGYWQPDKPSPEPVSSHKDQPVSETQKFF